MVYLSPSDAVTPSGRRKNVSVSCPLPLYENTHTAENDSPVCTPDKNDTKVSAFFSFERSSKPTDAPKCTVEIRNWSEVTTERSSTLKLEAPSGISSSIRLGTSEYPLFIGSYMSLFNWNDDTPLYSVNVFPSLS